VIATPPVLAGAEKVTLAVDVAPFATARFAVAVLKVGAPGTVAGVIEVVAAEAILLSAALFVAVTEKVYAVPAVKPVIV
jgi:hypothetical protein